MSKIHEWGVDTSSLRPGDLMRDGIRLWKVIEITPDGRVELDGVNIGGPEHADHVQDADWDEDSGEVVAVQCSCGAKWTDQTLGGSLV